MQANAVVTVNMGGSKVDSVGLGIQSTNVLGGAGSEFTLGRDLTTGQNLVGGGVQDFTVRTAGSTKTVTITGDTDGLSATDVVNQFNEQLNGTGISAAIGTDGKLNFYGGDTAFSIDAVATAATDGITGAAGEADLTNKNLYNSVATPGTTAAGDTLSFNVNGNSIVVTTTASESVANIAKAVNSSLNAYGIEAVVDSTGALINLQGTTAFTVTATGVPTVAGQTAATSGASNTANANAALAALTQAVTNLGLVQGKVGTGQNQLQYAVNLANSQISSFSAAESRIRDADVAAEAANLTKAQVLSQSSVAALSKANQTPQVLLSLIKNS